MNKEQTLQLKGVAILMMIWGHMFGNVEHVLSSYEPMFMLGGIPLVSIICRATGPVSFFLLLSGYGLYCVNRTGDKHRLSRICRLLITYWIVLLFVVGIGLLLSASRYSLSFPEVFVNLIGLNPTYIPEAWFMLPYILLALIAPWEFRQLGGVKTRYILPAAFLLNILTSLVISRYGAAVLYPNRVLYVIFCWFHFQFSFLSGMCMARMNLSRKMIENKTHLMSISRKLRIDSQSLVLILLAALLVLRCTMQTSALHSIYVCLFVLLWICLDLPSWLNKLLCELGRKSTAMWFVHTSLGLYLFTDLFNALTYPILVFAGVTFASWAVALGVDKIRGIIAVR